MVRTASPAQKFNFVELLKSFIGKPGWDYSERRGKLRVKCRIEASVLYGGGLIGAQILDISASGMKLLCSGRVAKKKVLEVSGVEPDRRAKLQSLRCETRWVNRTAEGWLVGVKLLSDMEQVSESWLAWQLREQRVKLVTAEQRRKHIRVNCKLPATFMSKDQTLEARVLNLSTEGALVQTFGRPIDEGSKVALTFGPHEHLPIIRVKAVVASVQGVSTKSYGIHFMELEAVDKRTLQHYMGELLRV